MPIRQVQKAVSFKDASDDLRELANVPMTTTYLQELSLRIGQEWQDLQEARVQALRDGETTPSVRTPAKGCSGDG